MLKYNDCLRHAKRYARKMAGMRLCPFKDYDDYLQDALLTMLSEGQSGYRFINVKFLIAKEFVSFKRRIVEIYKEQESESVAHIESSLYSKQLVRNVNEKLPDLHRQVLSLLLEYRTPEVISKYTDYSVPTVYRIIKEIKQFVMEEIDASVFFRCESRSKDSWNRQKERGQKEKRAKACFKGNVEAQETKSKERDGVQLAAGSNSENEVGYKVCDVIGRSGRDAGGRTLKNIPFLRDTARDDSAGVCRV